MRRPARARRERRRYVEAIKYLGGAVNSLATGPEDIRGRLPRVYLILSDIRVDDLPKVLRDDFRWVMGRMTARPARFSDRTTIFETTAEASVAAVRTVTATKIARRIVYLSDRLQDLSAAGE